MSVTHPLLKVLKAQLLELYNEKAVILDSNPKLQPFCQTLEAIVRLGLKSPSSWFNKSDYWSWMSKLPIVRNPAYDQIVTYTKQCQKATKLQGKGRLLLRCALVKHNIDTIIRTFLKDSQLIEQWYDSSRSILGDEILSEIFLSLLDKVKDVTFKLNLKNASFLDDYWELPVYKEYEFVPCEVLGIHIKEVNGHIVIVDVEPGSVAEEDGKISVGDVLDELFGESLNGAKKNRVVELFEYYKGIPVYAGIVKCYTEDDQIFRPIISLLRELDIDPEAIIQARVKESQTVVEDSKPPHALLPQDQTSQIPVHSAEEGAMYNVTYMGYHFIGADGRVDRIEESVLAVLNNKDSLRKAARITMTETGIIVQERDSDKIMLQHSYTEVSACGRRTDYLQHFGYIAGETTCNLAKNFICHVFHASSSDETKVILCSIAQGFNRTHWFL